MRRSPLITTVGWCALGAAFAIVLFTGAFVYFLLTQTMEFT